MLASAVKVLCMDVESEGDGETSSTAAGSEGIAPFVDGQYVRLRNRGRGEYLFAGEAGFGVSVDSRRGMVNTAWAVQVLQGERGTRVLLAGAYGRYLGITNMRARPGLVGCYVEQRSFDRQDDYRVEWWTVEGKRGSVVLLHGTADGPRPWALRANGRYKRRNRGVTIEAFDFRRYKRRNSGASTMMQWEVEIIPPTVVRPPYQPRPPSAEIQFSKDPDHPGDPGPEVEIRFTVAWVDNTETLRFKRWMDMQFVGRSLSELGNEIANRLGNGVEFRNMTLCVQAGNFGRYIPLLTDLPLRDDPVTILVFMVDAPGPDPLRFPDLEAE